MSQKKRPTLVSLISLATSSLGGWDISQIKGDIYRYVLSTNSFLCDIGESRYSHNNIGYHIIKIVKYRLIPNSQNLIPCIVLPVSQLPNIAQKTTQNVPMDVTFQLRYAPAF